MKKHTLTIVIIVLVALAMCFAGCNTNNRGVRFRAKQIDHYHHIIPYTELIWADSALIGGDTITRWGDTYILIGRAN